MSWNVRRRRGDHRTDAQILQEKFEVLKEEKQRKAREKEYHHNLSVAEFGRLTMIEQTLLIGPPKPYKPEPYEPESDLITKGEMTYRSNVEHHRRIQEQYPKLMIEIGETREEFQDRIRQTIGLPAIPRKPNKERDEFCDALSEL